MTLIFGNEDSVAGSHASVQGHTVWPAGAVGKLSGGEQGIFEFEPEKEIFEMASGFYDG